MLLCMRDVSGLEAHACSVGSRSRFTGTRQSRFPNPPMVYRYLRFLPLLLSVFALLVFGGFAPDARAAEIAPSSRVDRRKNTKRFR